MNNELTARELADKLAGELIGDPEKKITGVASLDHATEGDLSFLSLDKYEAKLKTTKAVVILVNKDFDIAPYGDKVFITCDDPNSVFNKAVDFFAPEPIKFEPQIHQSAVIAETAQIGEGVHIGANVVIEENAVIGDKTVILPNSYIGHNVKVGADTLIYPNVTVRENCTVGSRVILHPGAVIGADGFGFAPGPRGIVKIPQVGTVELGDEVEIGANSAVDRARFGKTKIGMGTKLDNLVQIGHNVEIGMFSMLCGQVGVAGSTKIGNGVILAGQVGTNGHINIGDKVTVGGNSGVLSDVEPGKTIVGYPAESKREFASRVSLPKKVKKLEARIKELEQKLKS